MPPWSSRDGIVLQAPQPHPSAQQGWHEQTGEGPSHASRHCRGLFFAVVEHRHRAERRDAFPVQDEWREMRPPGRVKAIDLGEEVAVPGAAGAREVWDMNDGLAGATVGLILPATRLRPFQRPARGPTYYQQVAP